MTKKEQLQKLFTSKHILRHSTIREAGIPSQLLTDMVRHGEIIRLERGIYALKGIEATEMSDLEILSHIVPSGVICLVSALRLHGLTNENPHQISVALKHGSHAPSVVYPPMQFSFFSGDAFSFGVESHPANNATIKVYSVEKTIADCFKYRNKIGLDVAIAALREAVRKNMVNYNELWKAAKICRIAKIIRPYMESMQ